ncbi:MAG: UDP-N-acetylmuramate:L-alanyl-gamma-D-glutamyl-meso-diaminopimelate ligase, partial [Gemmatimonadetes bacterium]|nr:UDP-N-acetylmuramate:L-alanyl-gamma-D-glutamyl-meso-diaminopimelate ligase [Gemmatimonadota bacterium]
FSPSRLSLRLVECGKLSWFEPDAAAIATRLAENVEAGDTIVFMSNGGFGSVQTKTLDALRARR